MDYPRDFIKEFILLYRKNRCLWNQKSIFYRNIDHRERAYQNLVKKLKEVDARADRKMVTRKINILRTSFRREYKKICSLQSEKYISSLWYYDLMKFLAEQNEQQIDDQDQIQLHQDINNKVNASATKFKTNNEINGTVTEAETNKEIPIECTIEKIEPLSLPPSPSSLMMDLPTELETNLQRKTNCSLDNESVMTATPKNEILQGTDSDMFQSFGNYVAAKLRNSMSQQSIFAEKLIADVLQKAALGTLNENTCLNDTLQYVMTE
ncbi:uncharacterized protein [Linepithema humile]|uniref:uncharacterized protein n=1 Tax=Linepithema humile TaxID=83485 RepID=UPI0006237BA9|nr:PREDICTED: uncharacterized protein LOC105669583 [Linepithema humile]XP_012218048.1 PREDICTED: uncharacterized protein LOC105669583 [Linepithema humile]XP_012218049.1 PREDICTED: uncharacterized protein LOC105669583 [Linepithema humile]